MMLLYHRSTGRTGRALARLLKLRCGRVPEEKVVIRWGSSTPAGLDVAINSLTSIRLAANSLRSLQAMVNEKISTPELYLTPPDNPGLYPILGRKLYHRAGLDIVWCNSREEAQQADRSYFTGYLRCDKEFRVHVFGSKVLRMFRKVPRASDADQTIKTSLRGWGYYRTTLDKHVGAQKLAIAATSVLGLTFGGVDVGWNRDQDKYIVFEVNTGPALNAVSLLYYARELEGYLKKQEVGYVSQGLCWTKEIERIVGGSNDTE